MRFNTLTQASVGLAACCAVTSAQSFTDCDPLTRDNCPPNKAFGPGTHTMDFTTQTSNLTILPMFTVDDGVKYSPQIMQYDRSLGAKLIIFKEPNAPTFWTNQYLFFGRVEVEMKAAPGQGIVTGITLQSDARDEIDFEFIGNHRTAVETNFYSKGVNDHTHVNNITVGFDPTAGLHVYALEWTAGEIRYIIDGAVVRTATPAELGADAGTKWPQTPCQLRIGTWLGGGAEMQASQQGTVDWAGGPVQWGGAPFEAIVKRVTVVDYANGRGGAKEYVYGDRSGSVGSIKVIT